MERSLHAIDRERASRGRCVREGRNLVLVGERA
jgi:hypothetical protein